MRTPTEIFEEVLDAWDDDVKALGSTYPGPRKLDEHRAKAAAYREEFRQAMGPGGTVHGRIEVVERAPFLLFDEDDVPPESTASAEEAFQGAEEAEVNFEAPTPPQAQVIDLMRALKDSLKAAPPLSLTVSSTPPTLDAEILREPPPLPELIDKLREAPSVAAAMDEALQERPAPWYRCSNCGEWCHPMQCHFPCNGLDDDEEFRRRRDKNAERYTRADGSPK